MEITQFIEDFSSYIPTGTLRKQFESSLKSTILSRLEAFREAQENGTFEDKTGDKYLGICKQVSDVYILDHMKLRPKKIILVFEDEEIELKQLEDV